MFERFTDRARRVVVLAQEEARLFNHSYIGTEHLLLGLLREDEGIAAKVLHSVGLNLGDGRKAVEDRVGVGPEAPKGHIPFTPRAKKVLELSLRQAMRLGHSYIGTEHLLLGLLEEGEGVAAQILISNRLGEGLEQVRDAVMTFLVEAGTVKKGQAHFERVREQMRQATESGVRRDDLVVRLEAIEARLSAIEALLRAQGEEREAQ